MLLPLFALAFAEGCDPVAALPDVRAGDKDAYLCVVKADAGKDALLRGLDEGGEFPQRLTRALALWMLWHSDRPMAPDLLARLGPADRRLLADGIKARRGRASPVPEHATVFAQFSWYEPEPGYTDGRLRDIDRQNLAAIDAANRPRPVAKEEDPDAGLPTPSVSADAPNLCGCAAPVPLAGGWGALLALVALRRRR